MHTPPMDFPSASNAAMVTQEIQDDPEDCWVEGHQQLLEVPQTTKQSSEIIFTSRHVVMQTHHSLQRIDTLSRRIPSISPDAELREVQPPSRSPVFESPANTRAVTPTAVSSLPPISTTVTRASPEGVDINISHSPAVSLPSPQSAIPGRSLEFLQPHTTYKGSYNIQFHQHSFRQESQTSPGETRWHYYRAPYTFASPIGLQLRAPLQSGDIFLHENTATGELRAWVWVWGGTGWVAAQEGHRHPTIADRRLWFVDRKAREGEKTAPSWVTHRTLMTYRSSRRRAAKKERAGDGSAHTAQLKQRHLTKGFPATEQL
ncbi:hypothetical protein C8Q80DRAFT_230775 [Daedaleopsis nitida]|nr:hypothetical protein C8Q80DRAFT_230775 [Daedaleopsis nitida]